MAGMLPGVESARRRRFHQSGGGSDLSSTAVHGASTRRSSFCLYASNHASPLSSSSSSLRSTGNQADEDEKLGGVAREAKERLDERLKALWKSDSKRTIISTLERFGGVEEGRTRITRTSGDLQTEEVFGSKKSGSKRFNWAKSIGWKASDQDECAICLEPFKTGETLMHLPCAHRFHSRCLVPWLEANAHCPCCRLGVVG